MLCQYNNINVTLHQYLKEKKKKKKKRDSRNQSTIAVRSQCKNTECMVIYIKEKKKYKQKIEKKKKKNYVATVPLGTVTTVQNFKKKKNG